MLLSMIRKLHISGHGTLIGRAGRGLALLMCGFLCLLSWKCDAGAEGYYTPVNAWIPFVCYAEKNVESEFQIRIKSESADAPLPDADTFHIDREGQGSFRIELTEPGTFDYLVYEIEGSDEQVRYDRTRYDIHIFVTADASDRLEYTVAVNYAGTDRKPVKVEFKNDVKGAERPSEDTSTEEGTTEDTTERPPTNVKTGDDTSLTLLITLCTVSASGILAILGIVMIRRSRDRRESDTDPGDNPEDTDKSDE